MLDVLAVVAGAILIGSTLLDAFETIVLPRRVTRQVRLARVFFRTTWRPWSALSWRLPSRWRETYLSFYGPLSLILLISIWAATMIVSFGLISWGTGSVVNASGEDAGLGVTIYESGTNFFTLGLGDFGPDSTTGRILTVIETGAGFGFLALVITYLPVLYADCWGCGLPRSSGRRFGRSGLLDEPGPVRLLWRGHGHRHRPLDQHRLDRAGPDEDGR